MGKLGGGGETKVQYESIKLFITLKVKSQVKPNLFCAEIRLHLTSSHNDCSRMLFCKCILYTISSRCGTGPMRKPSRFSVAKTRYSIVTLALSILTCP